MRQEFNVTLHFTDSLIKKTSKKSASRFKGESINAFISPSRLNTTGNQTKPVTVARNRGRHQTTREQRAVISEG